MSLPNVLFLMTDQQRWDAQSHIADWCQTPNLDLIASEGVSFTQCVTTTPICIPARVTLATGLYPHNTHVWTNIQYSLPTTSQTWMKTLRDLGYRTSMFGKTHLHPHRGDLREREHLLNEWGIDDVNEIGGPRASAAVMSHMTALWEEKGLLQAYRDDFADRFSTKPHVVRPSTLPLEYYADVYVGQQAKNYLANYERDQPWMCWVSWGGPHEPWDAPEPYASMYDPVDMPKPLPRFTSAKDRPHGYLDVFMERRSPKFDEGDESRMRANYAGNVSLIDEQIGQIIDTIKDRGEWDQTIVAFTSDHGEMNGDHGLIYKMNFLDGAVRVPLLFRSPEAVENGGILNNHLVENVDLGATVVDLVGSELDYRQHGESLKAGFNGDVPSKRTGVISEFAGEIMFTNESWKCALNREGELYLLFDRIGDPSESRNLANLPDMKDVEIQLRKEIVERLASTQLTEPWY